MKAPGPLPGIVIRNCEALEELDACVRLQQEVWGFSDLEVVPMRMLVVANKIGGHIAGAFAGSELVGFALAFPARRKGHPYIHSHMLAVQPGYRDRGIGRQLKLFQREAALKQGVDLIEWTFDPLEIKNAWLNVEKLGAITRRYVVDQYGVTSSPLHGGLPSDRFVAEWWLSSRRVVTTLREGRHAPVVPERTVTVPAGVYDWKAQPATRHRAAEVQLRNRKLLMDAFAAGLAVLGYELDAQGNGTMQLAHWDEPWRA